MAKFPSTASLNHIGRWRLFASMSAEMELARVQTVATVTTIKAAPDYGAGKTDTTFWMKNPKTGYWVPENHFEDVDAAELRAALLPKKGN